jgi:hypothetical protein
MRKPGTKDCHNCGENFSFMFGSKKEFEARKFCSTKCNGTFYAEKYSVDRQGKGNPMFKKEPWNFQGFRWAKSGSRKRYKKLFIKGKYIWEHRFVAEITIGRKLKKDEVVHHIDHNPQNNSPSNLKVMTKFEHSSYHGKLQGKNYAKRKPKSSV